MAKERAESSRARLFVALDLPDAVRSALGTWGEEALADPALRPVAAENLHITLVELIDPVARPSRGRARLFALPALSPGAEALQAALAEHLRAAGLYEPEKRPFWPHLTIARVRGEARGSRRPAAVRNPPKDLPTGLAEAFHGVRMTLYRSVLQPSGARYLPLAQYELPGGRQ